jgi:hypothetical protein
VVWLLCIVAPRIVQCQWPPCPPESLRSLGEARVSAVRIVWADDARGIKRRGVKGGVAEAIVVRGGHVGVEDGDVGSIVNGISEESVGCGYWDISERIVRW